MTRVVADLWCTGLWQLPSDSRIDEFYSACSAATAGVVRKKGSGGNKARSGIRIDRLRNKRPSPLIPCDEELVMSTWGKATTFPSIGLLNSGLHDFSE